MLIRFPRISLILIYNHINHHVEYQALSVRIRNLIWRACTGLI